MLLLGILNNLRESWGAQNCDAP